LERAHTDLFAAAGLLAGYRSILGPHRSFPWTAEQLESDWLIRKHALSHIVTDCQVRIPANTPTIAIAVFFSSSNQTPQYYVDLTAIIFSCTLANDLPPTPRKAGYRQHRKITT